MMMRNILVELSKQFLSYHIQSQKMYRRCLLIFALGTTALVLLTSDVAATNRKILTIEDSLSCPPAGFDSVPDFDVVAYASAPWYPQQQVTRALHDAIVSTYVCRSALQPDV